MTTRSGSNSLVSATAALSSSARNSAVPTCRSDIWTILTPSTLTRRDAATVRRAVRSGQPPAPLVAGLAGGSCVARDGWVVGASRGGLPRGRAGGGVGELGDELAHDGDDEGVRDGATAGGGGLDGHGET